jgi:hypothetical protein
LEAFKTVSFSLFFTFSLSLSLSLSLSQTRTQSLFSLLHTHTHTHSLSLAHFIQLCLSNTRTPDCSSISLSLSFSLCIFLRLCLFSSWKKLFGFCRSKSKRTKNEKSHKNKSLARSKRKLPGAAGMNHMDKNSMKKGRGVMLRHGGQRGEIFVRTFLINWEGKIIRYKDLFHVGNHFQERLLAWIKR